MTLQVENRPSKRPERYEYLSGGSTAPHPKSLARSPYFTEALTYHIKELGLYWNPQDSAETKSNSWSIQNKLAYLTALIDRPISSDLRLFLVRSELLDHLLEITWNLSAYFSYRQISIEVNSYREEGHLLDIGVESSEDFDADLRILNQFDMRWWVNQPDSLRSKILIVLR